jgi:hypothetical protein
MCNQDPQYNYTPDFTPNPDGPVPLPGQPGLPGIPGFPFPERPVPLPPDFWRCFRLGPVSGRYEATSWLSFGTELVLRVDIDPRSSVSPVMNRVSGDTYRLSRIGSNLPGRFAFWRHTYLESWIVETPAITWRRCSVEITGAVTFWKGVHPATTVRVIIKWGRFTGAGPAEVTFFEGGVQKSAYTCQFKSRNFRDVQLEIDVCNSVNTVPLVPTYDTHAHNNRPADTPQRTLTIENSYAEAGIGLTIEPAHTVIDDSAVGFTSWSSAELHDAMETHFSQFPSGWPKWKMWGVLAGRHDTIGVGGIMFDAAAGATGGAGEPPHRQGFAVFRNHSWFTQLPAGAPANQAEAQALRHYLYTYVHEAGHAFNFLHSWDKSRPSSLSWMNYDWKYDDLNGANQFWANFRFRFDDEELIHIRHGDRNAVIMGGDNWGSGGHLEGEPASFPQEEGEPLPLEFLARTSSYFEWLEPVIVELRLRNRMPGIALEVDARLQPEQDNVVIQIRKPNGEVVEYRPLMHLLETPDVRQLEAADGQVPGQDRYSEAVDLTFGADGFYFDEPGEYAVRALYRGLGALLLPSNAVRLRIGMPMSKEDNRLAGDFFTRQVGTALYLGGSRSPHLEKGMDVLRSVASENSGSLLGAHAAMAVAAAEARAFFRLDGDKVKRSHQADPRGALKISEAALKVFEKDRSPRLSIPYRKLAERRAAAHRALGDTERASSELEALSTALKARGVNQSVLEEIGATAPEAGTTKPKKTASRGKGRS